MFQKRLLALWLVLWIVPLSAGAARADMSACSPENFDQYKHASSFGVAVFSDMDVRRPSDIMWPYRSRPTLAPTFTPTPTPTLSPTPSPTPSSTPVPLALLDYSPLAGAGGAYTQPTDIAFVGTMPIGHTLTVFACNGADDVEPIELGTVDAEAEGGWSYRLTSTQLAQYFEDRQGMSVIFQDQQDGRLSFPLVYNAEQSATATDCRFFTHGDRLMLIGKTRPGISVHEAGGTAETISNAQGDFELTMSAADHAQNVSLILEDDTDHPQSISVENTRPKALIGFLQPVDTGVLLLLLLALLAPIIALLLVPKRMQKKETPANVAIDDLESTINPHKGGDNHA